MYVFMCLYVRVCVCVSIWLPVIMFVICLLPYMYTSIFLFVYL